MEPYNDVKTVENADRSGQEHETFFRNVRMILCFCLAGACLTGAFSGFFSLNSVYLKSFTGFSDGTPNILPFTVYSLINALAYICLGVFALITAGTERRYLKLAAAKAGYKRTGAGYTDINKEKALIKKITSCEKSIKVANVFSAVFAILALLLFIGLFILSGLSRTIINYSKKEIGRDDNDYRVITDCVSQGLFTFTVASCVFTVPVIMKRERKLNAILLVILGVTAAVPLIHYAYFYFGNITAHASPADLAAFLLPLLFIGFIGVNFAAERREKLVADLRK